MRTSSFFISFAIFATLSITPSYCRNSDWVNKFRKATVGLRYSHHQYSLEILHKTGRANCVAYAKLAAEIAIDSGLECESIIIDAEGDQECHMITLIQSEDGSLWSTSNKQIYEVYSEKDAVNRAAVSIDTHGLKWKIVKRHFFTPKELELDFDYNCY